MARTRSSAEAGAGALDEYANRRSFHATPEPAPHEIGDRTGPLLFVVQQHDARQQHFDFRLELDGVLKSWAVPKGMLIQPGEPHLAVPTEDHPLAYGSFEGVIPPGQYGAGTVIVWDCGLYSPDEGAEYAFHDREAAQDRVRMELAAGKLSICLLGEKLKGSYALVRTRKDKSWLLLKHRDARPLRPSWSEDMARSVLTPYAVANAGNVVAADRLTFDKLIPNGPTEDLPSRLAPMLASLADAPFGHRDWMFEPKLDGYRILAHVGLDAVRLRTRNGIDVTAAFPRLVDDLKRQPVLPMLLDGEIVVLRDGRPSFDALQDRVQLKAASDIEAADRATPSVFFCFDLLHVLGMNVRNACYSDRRRYLGQCLSPTPRIQLVHAEADGEALYRAALAAGFEGMMAKRRSSLYHPGRRSDEWLKIKHVRSAEFIVGGYTEGKGARRDQFGALTLGVWDDGALLPVGNVGSGFDDKALGSLKQLLVARQVGTMPFATRPEADGKMFWTRPDLVAEVEFAGWTDAGNLRAPVFLRLRNDVDPTTVTLARARERSAGPEAKSTSAAGTGSALTDAILQQLSGTGAGLTLAVNGNRIKLTHLDKVLWPAQGTGKGYTKRHLLQYLALAAPFMLRHLAQRPLTVIRMPDGIDGEAFFQKHFDGSATPEFVRVVELVGEEGASRRYVLCNNVETLLWLGQMGVLEFHVPHASVPAGAPAKIDENEVFDRPDYVVFDLDPYIYSGREAKGAEPEFNSPGFAKAREVAFHLREILAAMSLQAFVKTTGKTGLHIFVPIERTITADQAREVCRLVGDHLRRKHPNDITMEWAVEKRTGRIFFDHNMNGRGRTLNAAYSPRRIPGAWVATPVTWEELARIEPGTFTLSTVPQRLRDNGDPWQGILQARHDLTRMFTR
ncbi:MAG TPA: DNA ligase D [Burkholderiaceae bacterium]|nr:DNA ligase D [Burkholderiaceae bacterium]